MIPEEILGDVSMRACGQNTEAYLVKKEFSSADILRDQFKLDRIPDSEIRFGIGANSWIRKDGEIDQDRPDYVWIVARRLP